MASGVPSGGIIAHEDKSTYVARELQVERERSKLQLEQLTHLIDGGKECTDKRRRIGERAVYTIVYQSAKKVYMSLLATARIFLDNDERSDALAFSRALIVALCIN